MTDLFASPRYMLRHGERRITDLDAEIQSFINDKPWSKVVEKDSDSVTDLHKIKFTERLSEDLAGIVFDAANNLRSVLDQLGFAIASAHTGNEAPKSCKFPFGPTKTLMENDAARGCKDLPAEIRDLFEGFKPYKGGNDALWTLNELANRPKHKLIIPVVIGGGGTSIMITEGSPLIVLDRFTIQAPIWDSEKNEITFLAVGPKTQVRGDVDVTFGVSFDNSIEFTSGKEPVALLRCMARKVEGVLMATEAECRRIGLVV